MAKSQKRVRVLPKPPAAAVPAAPPVSSRPAPAVPSRPLPPVAHVRGQLELDREAGPLRVDHLADVARHVRVVDDARRQLAFAVAAARAEGASYADLARVLGVSRQAVRQQFTGASA